MGKIIRRILTIIPAVALQSLWLLLLMKWLTPYAPIIVSLLSVAAFFLVVFIIIKRDETAYKLLWLLVILSLPLVGALLYLLFGNKRTARPLKRRLQQVQKSCNPQPLPIKEYATNALAYESCPCNAGYAHLENCYQKHAISDVCS